MNYGNYFSCIGVVLTVQEAHDIFDKDCQFENWEVMELRELIYEKVIGAMFIDSDDAYLDSAIIYKDGTWDYDADTTIENEDLFVFEVNKDVHPTLFTSTFKSYEELKDSLVKDYGSYLPEDFDWESHIRYTAICCDD